MALGGLAYSVAQAFPEVRGTFDDPAAVRQWLANIDRIGAVTA